MTDDQFKKITNCSAKYVQNIHIPVRVFLTKTCLIAHVVMRCWWWCFLMLRYSWSNHNMCFCSCWDEMLVMRFLIIVIFFLLPQHFRHSLLCQILRRFSSVQPSLILLGSSLLVSVSRRFFESMNQFFALFVRDGIHSDADYNSSRVGVAVNVVVIFAIFIMG